METENGKNLTNSLFSFIFNFPHKKQFKVGSFVITELFSDRIKIIIRRSDSQPTLLSCFMASLWVKILAMAHISYLSTQRKQ